jgi:hypothetical protein
MFYKLKLWLKVYIKVVKVFDCGSTGVLNSGNYTILRHKCSAILQIM